MFDGETNVVNGTVWPNMNVQRHAYRFRFLNSSNQRFYRFSSRTACRSRSSATTAATLRTAQTVTAFNLGVTERVDTLIDFSQPPGGDEGRPAEHRAAAAADRRGARIRTPTARSCSSPSSAAPSVPPRALPGDAEQHRRR